MRIWIDITNTPHVNVLMPLYRHLMSEGHVIIITARDFSETIPLLRQNGIEPLVFGGHYGKSKIKKVLGMIMRLIKLYLFVPKFDLSFSMAGEFTSTVSFFRCKPSIAFTDNDYVVHQFPVFLFSKYFIFPKYFNYETVQKKYQIKKERINTFNGFKEDLYIADYKVDENFLRNLPFKEFITIRPENLKAAYVPKDAVSIVPQLFEEFKDENILFLPRYESEKTMAKGYPNVWFPNSPLVGLDVCYYTKAMLTGAGTFAREAALLGVPAVSFYPRKDFLTVDDVLQKQGKEFASRDVKEIRNYINIAVRTDVSIERCKSVLSEFLSIFDEIIKQNTK